jgi:ribonuclease HI
MSSISFLFYCDGGCHGNPGPGGWGFWGHTPSGCLERWGGMRRTTNNQMELTAAIEALRSTPTGSTVEVRTDSRYVVDGVHSWRKGWEARGWKGVKNREIWEELFREVDTRHVTFKWVRGHSGDAGNEKADRLAQAGIALLSTSPQATPRSERLVAGSAA